MTGSTTPDYGLIKRAVAAHLDWFRKRQRIPPVQELADVFTQRFDLYSAEDVVAQSLRRLALVDERLVELRRAAHDALTGLVRASSDAATALANLESAAIAIAAKEREQLGKPYRGITERGQELLSAPRALQTELSLGPGDQIITTRKQWHEHRNTVRMAFAKVTGDATTAYDLFPVPDEKGGSRKSNISKLSREALGDPSGENETKT